MADKETTLSIIIRTVDKATARIQAINKRIDEGTKPTRDLGKALSDLAKKKQEMGGLKEIGSALYDLSGIKGVVGGFKDIGNALAGLAGKAAAIGGLVGVATAGLLSLVDHYDALGDTAERLGTSADFLAAFRYAAERAGAPIEGVDEALQTLVTNMGAAKAGTGKMLKFLQQISPTFAKQVTSANSLEEALGLLANAEAKLPDAARRAKLAAATLGDPKLAPLLAKGAAGVQELLTEYYHFAGAQGEAAAAAGETDDALKKLHASTDGVKAALVKGLSPALTKIIDKMSAWLVDHREDIERWAEDIGRKLPDAVDNVVDAVKGAVRWGSDFVRDIGGWKVAAGGAAAVMTGPLLSAFGNLSVALMTTPFGQLTLAIGASILALKELLDLLGLYDEKIHNKPKAEPGGIIGRVRTPKASIQEWTDTASEPVGPKVAAVQTVTGFRGIVGGRFAPRPTIAIPPELRLAPQVSAAPTESKLVVDFKNVPRNVRVTQDPGNGSHIEANVGYQMGAGL